MTTRLSSRSVRRPINISTHRAALVQRAADMPHDGAAAAAAAGDGDEDEDADGGDGRWREPLSLQALSDYTTQLAAAGQGPFSLGHVRLWPINRHSV